MARYLELNADGFVINVIVWDGLSPYAPTGITLLPCDDHPNATFGWQYDGTNWTAPPEPEPEPEP